MVSQSRCISFRANSRGRTFRRPYLKLSFLLRCAPHRLRRRPLIRLYPRPLRICFGMIRLHQVLPVHSRLHLRSHLLRLEPPPSHLSIQRRLSHPPIFLALLILSPALPLDPLSVRRLATRRRVVTYLLRHRYNFSRSHCDRHDSYSQRLAWG